MDKIFKIGLLVLGFGYLAYLFCPFTSQVGRYEVSDRSILDTVTGDLYTSGANATNFYNYYKMRNPITGKSGGVVLSE